MDQFIFFLLLILIPIQFVCSDTDSPEDGRWGPFDKEFEDKVKEMQKEHDERVKKNQELFNQRREESNRRFEESRQTAAKAGFLALIIYGASGVCICLCLVSCCIYAINRGQRGPYPVHGAHLGMNMYPMAMGSSVVVVGAPTPQDVVLPQPNPV